MMEPHHLTARPFDEIPLFSIKPVHSQKIFTGRKTVELRKRAPKRLTDTILVYESSPTRILRGMLTIKRVKQLAVEDIINKYAKKAAVEPEFISEYYHNHQEGYVIEILQYKEFEKPIPLDILKKKMDFHPPQDYMYVNLQDILATGN